MSDIVRGIVTLVDDEKKCQALQTEVSQDEVLDGVEHVQPFGVSFRPPVETECVVLTLADDPGNCVAFGVTDRANRPKGLTEPGTGGLYYRGTYKVFIDKDGIVHLGAKEADQFVALAQKVLDELNDIRSKFDNHTHLTNAINGSGFTATNDAPQHKMGLANSVAASATKAT